MITAIILMCEVASGQCIAHAFPKTLPNVDVCEIVAKDIIHKSEAEIIRRGGHEDNQTFDYQCVGWWKA